MTRKTVWNVALGAAVTSVALFTATAAMGETLVQNTVENRVLLAFRVDSAALAKMMPDGWTPITLPKGPVAGSNLILSFFDKLLITDAEGAPSDPASQPVMALVAYGTAEGVEGVRSFVTAIYEVPPLVDPFGLSEAADITRDAGMRYGADGRTRTEAWVVQPASGGTFSFDLDYAVKGYAWSEDGTSMPYSAADPAFHEIYRFDQLAELVMNTTAGREIDGNVSYSAEIPALSGLFDGTEELVAVVSIPVYLRQVFTPDAPDM
ncbi:MAG: hypothetical protein KDK28_09280 [Maritimibacter sp.]|nr:hypothetical protein [Maritimibacter sp.]